ncbi:MAG: YebC/PmpR family DNA-binding transcriptional regulator [Elusimicrobiaceae bacterium]|jgi:YebC/PmpR family DNA-binding regulatory protein|nr:YebC/PmpR family DNA-binding transcriptional regulator [Elusimicrobiaceae bacterium]MBT3955494.1 YebC/PmpR family DNA-binding transcriptional regulator [Elusimicrobiaceae bacterium]MBT4008550.1 YebC/PmpR family DNA-binding transcriptional regulator [Elusimicrobiaceae bacterium]MBT4402377.1 YebC/PmpR family DNA-binding transcriptional regulator [Elusimicrobiaceae bacterium]MBT4440333.1 YebC/PmpR family DNA-binding transcriptional regulator [Elusimicrobiaceae bacterium]
MAGHSHWAGIKHKKAIVDAKRGKIFTKIVREITIAAKMGGAELDNNPRLRKAIDDGKKANMPIDNIKKAVLKGTGQLPGAVYEEITYEGYGPGKTAVIVECTTDNKNRTFSEIRNIFTKRNGTIGTTGCVSYMFKKKGFISILKSAIDEDKLMEIAIEAGADDIKTDDEKYFEILTDPENFDTVKEALEKQNIPLETAEITMLADTDVKIKDKKTAEQIFKFMEGLESHDDTKNVYSNFDIDEEIIKQLG